MCGSGFLLSGSTPVCLGEAAWCLPLWGRGSRATSCLRRVYEVSPTPSFLLITLPASSWAASNALYYLHLQPEPLTSLCQCLCFPSDLKPLSTHEWQQLMEASLHSPHFSVGPRLLTEGQELSSVSPCGNHIVHIEYLNSSMHQFFSVDID